MLLLVICALILIVMLSLCILIVYSFGFYEGCLLLILCFASAVMLDELLIVAVVVCVFVLQRDSLLWDSVIRVHLIVIILLYIK